MVVALRDVQIAACIKANFMRHVQRCFERWAAVAAIASLAVSGDGRELFRCQVEPADSLVVEVAEKQGAVGTDDEAVGIVDLCIRESRRAVSD